MLPRRKSYRSRHDAQWLVAGLGNPGPEYRDTPHNVGFQIVDRLASARRVPMLAKHEGLYGVGAFDDRDVALLMPLTFMNLSGRSVKPALKALGLTADRLLVIHDEIDLPFGQLQLREGGGLAGHNGLRSINESLGTSEFLRLRVGVGRPSEGDRRPIRDWILSSWGQSPEEVGVLVDDAARAVELVVSKGLRSAMNTVNGKPARPDRPERPYRDPGRR